LFDVDHGDDTVKLPGFLKPQSRYAQMLLAFIFVTLLISGLAVWQLHESTPTRWCVLAQGTSSDQANACLQVLLKLLDIKDHAVIGLLVILGLLVTAVVVVALGVRVAGSAPGGVSVDVSSSETKVQAGDTTVAVPTPPSGEEEVKL
jgi:hypothetical protein